ncbi:MAG: antitoxin component YwqK of YwqJK toxin-antitoxin module [Sulfurimonas sp.]|jgi:antitoxin component YwqK of YwqJK toxin-antitoxin module
MLQFAHIRTSMKEKHKISYYPSKNVKTETYKLDNTFVTKNFYNAKDAYVRELINEENGIKEVKHFTEKGVLAKLEHFVGDKRQGQEIKYVISKANKSVKSIKLYDDGKLHGESITYNQEDEIIKQEVFALGKLVFKYLREDGVVTKIQIIDKESIENLSKIEYEKLQLNMQEYPNLF